MVDSWRIQSFSHLVVFYKHLHTDQSECCLIWLDDWWPKQLGLLHDSEPNIVLQSLHWWSSQFRWTNIAQLIQDPEFRYHVSHIPFDFSGTSEALWPLHLPKLTKPSTQSSINKLLDYFWFHIISPELQYVFTCIHMWWEPTIPPSVNVAKDIPTKNIK